MSFATAPFYPSGSPASNWDNEEQSGMESSGSPPLPALFAGPSLPSEWRAALPWCDVDSSLTASGPPPPLACSEQITADAPGCDITLWDTFDLQTVFNGDSLVSTASVSSQTSIPSITAPERPVLPSTYVEPQASPTEEGCEVSPIDVDAFNVGLPGTPTLTPGRGTKRKRGTPDSDGMTRTGRKRRLQSSSAFVGFPVTDPVFMLTQLGSDHIPPHDRKRMYLESLEEYTVWLEDQIRIVGLVPASMERVSTFQELKARTVRTVIFHQEEVLRNLHLRRQDLQNKCRDLLRTAEAALVRGLET
ncbi:hypothetical protein C8Q76DRAFT_688958 [Earliella scabrosa]|nr:hypothetical protein C8Q76DRAFT_688958 [Earliella scabrosa]